MNFNEYKPNIRLADKYEKIGEWCCDECGFELTYDRFPTKTRKAMDHCHKSGLFRNILCHKCNTKRRY